MIALLFALLVQDYMAAGEGWARDPIAARCYIELSARSPDPDMARDASVRARLREIAQERAGLTASVFLKLSSADRDQEADLREKADLVANNLMSQEEYDAVAAMWATVRQSYLTIIGETARDYPSCRFTEPMRWMPSYDATMAAAALAITSRAGE